MTAEQTQIQAFLRGAAIEAEALPSIRKAGIVPFMRGENLRYYMMVPVASKPDLGLPEFQICKGTRMYRVGDTWQDMRGVVPQDVECEALPETALREGMEELGLKLENIAKAHALGEYSFTSATNRKEVQLWLLAAEMKSAVDFLPINAIARSTASREWLTLAEFKKQGRADHAHILAQIEERLLCA